MKIEILGSGCPKCKELERRTREAVKKSGVAADVEHIYDLQKIIQRSVFSTPALVIDGKVIFSGRVPSIEELSKMLSGK
jgi:small redox-active disulfide protein 2